MKAKRKRESQEPDLYVDNKRLTEKEKQELRDYIEEYKKKKTAGKKYKRAA